MWMIYATVNYSNGHEEDYTQGPWPLPEVHAFIDLILKTEGASRFVFTIVPEPEPQAA